MRTKLRNKLNSFKEIVAWDSAFGVLLITHIMLSAKLTLFKAKVASIDAAEKIFSSISKGQAAFKNRLGKLMVDAIFQIAGALHSIGKDKGNVEMAAYCNFTKSELDEQRDADKALTCQKVLEYAAGYIPELAGEQITAEKIAEATDKTTAFTDEIDKQARNVEIRRATLKSQIQDFKDADILLKDDIDGLVEAIKDENPQAYAQYWNAREIKDLGATHQTEEQIALLAKIAQNKVLAKEKAKADRLAKAQAAKEAKQAKKLQALYAKLAASMPPGEAGQANTEPQNK